MTRSVGTDALTVVKASSTKEGLSDTKAAISYHFMRGNSVALKFITKTPILETVKKPRFWKIFTADASKLEDYIYLGDTDSSFDLAVKIEAASRLETFKAVLPSLRVRQYTRGKYYRVLLLEQRVGDTMIPLRFTSAKTKGCEFYSLLEETHTIKN